MRMEQWLNGDELRFCRVVNFVRCVVSVSLRPALGPIQPMQRVPGLFSGDRET